MPDKNITTGKIYVIEYPNSDALNRPSKKTLTANNNDKSFNSHHDLQTGKAVLNNR